jgi:hypothetical protein
MLEAERVVTDTQADPVSDQELLPDASDDEDRDVDFVAQTQEEASTESDASSVSRVSRASRASAAEKPTVAKKPRRSASFSRAQEEAIIQWYQDDPTLYDKTNKGYVFKVRNSQLLK